MRSFFIRFLPVCLVCITSGSVSAQMVGTKGNLTISDETLQHVWSRAFEGFWARDGYSSELATASYSLYSPDPVPMLRAHYYLESSVSIPRSILSRSFAPSGDTGGGSAEYSLHWPVLLEQYHRFRGDDDYVRAMCESALPLWLEHFEGQLSDEGLLRTCALDEDPILAGIEIVVDGESESAVINMLYYRAVIAMARLHRELGMESDHWKEKADGLRAAILKNFWSDDLDLFVDNPGSDHASIAANALAVCLGLSDTIEEAVSLIRREGAACSTLFVPYVVEACFLADEHQLAIDLMSFVEDFSRDPSPLYLIPRHVFGVSPDSAGWGTIEVTPSLVRTAESALLEVPLPLGRLRFSYTSENGAQITIPVGSRVTLDAPEGMSVVVKKYRSHTMPESLSEEARAVLDASGWGDRAGDDAFIWVSVDEQILRIMRGETIEYESRCASAEKGIGSLMNSFKTPLGWHSVAKKIGDDAPWGQVFKSRIATREIWQPGENVSEDMVLSRILLLNGEESGLNKGGKVDSFARNIYIHGTNDEARIGVPSSHGCIRMLNDDVIEIYGMVGEGMLVLITGTEEDLEREDA